VFAEMGMVVGQQQLLGCRSRLFTGGHIAGRAPGLAKTLIISTLAKVLHRQPLSAGAVHARPVALGLGGHHDLQPEPAGVW
jgi:hypothetical protein